MYCRSACLPMTSSTDNNVPTAEAGDVPCTADLLVNQWLQVQTTMFQLRRQVTYHALQIYLSTTDFNYRQQCSNCGGWWCAMHCRFSCLLMTSSTDNNVPTVDLLVYHWLQVQTTLFQLQRWVMCHALQIFLSTVDFNYRQQCSNCGGWWCAMHCRSSCLPLTSSTDNNVPTAEAGDVSCTADLLVYHWLQLQTTMFQLWRRVVCHAL